MFMMRLLWCDVVFVSFLIVVGYLCDGLLSPIMLLHCGGRVWCLSSTCDVGP